MANTLAFQRAVKGFGVEFADGGDHLVIKVPKKGSGQLSSTGKTDMAASTGGWVPTGIDGLSISVMAGVSTKGR